MRKLMMSWISGTSLLKFVGRDGIEMGDHVAFSM